MESIRRVQERSSTGISVKEECSHFEATQEDFHNARNSFLTQGAAQNAIASLQSAVYSGQEFSNLQSRPTPLPVSFVSDPTHMFDFQSSQLNNLNVHHNQHQAYGIPQPLASYTHQTTGDESALTIPCSVFCIPPVSAIASHSHIDDSVYAPVLQAYWGGATANLAPLHHGDFPSQLSMSSQVQQDITNPVSTGTLAYPNLLERLHGSNAYDGWLPIMRNQTNSSVLNRSIPASPAMLGFSTVASSGIGDPALVINQCVNCGVTQTASSIGWRMDNGGNSICSRCVQIFGLGEPRGLTQHESKKMNVPRRQSTSCVNCKITTTTLWRRNSQGESVCNACGLYFKLHGVSRPLSMRKDGIQTRRRKLKAKHEESNVKVDAQKNELREQNMNHVELPLVRESDKISTSKYEPSQYAEHVRTQQPLMGVKSPTQHTSSEILPSGTNLLLQPKQEDEMESIDSRNVALSDESLQESLGS